MLVDKQRAGSARARSATCASWPNGRRTTSGRGRGGSRSPTARHGPGSAKSSRTAMQAHGDPPEKVEKARTKYLRTPVTWWSDPAPAIRRCERPRTASAVAAGIQIMLLAADRKGWRSYWGTCPKGANDMVAETVRLRTGHPHRRPRSTWVGRRRRSNRPVVRRPKCTSSLLSDVATGGGTTACRVVLVPRCNCQYPARSRI